MKIAYICIIMADVLLFGIARELANGSIIRVPDDIKRVKELKCHLIGRYPELKRIPSVLVAVNHKYAGDDLLLKPGDEIAIIPPVSGG